jgi:hypothetical protein
MTPPFLTDSLRIVAKREPLPGGLPPPRGHRPPAGASSSGTREAVPAQVAHARARSDRTSQPDPQVDATTVCATIEATPRRTREPTRCPWRSLRSRSQPERSSLATTWTPTLPCCRPASGGPSGPGCA